MLNCCTDKPITPPRKASANVQFGYLYGIVNLTCEAEAEPAADFTWYRNNKKLSPKVHLIHSEGHESILQVRLIVCRWSNFIHYKANETLTDTR